MLELRRRPRDAATRLDRGQNAAPFAAIDTRHSFALGQRRLSVVRASDHVEHVRLKRVLTRRIRIRLRAAGGPLHLGGIVLVHERRRIVLDELRLLIFLTIIVKQLRHLRLHRQRTVVALIGYRHDDLVQRLRRAHAGIQGAELLRLPNLIRIRTRLRVADVLEVERHLCISRSAERLRYLDVRLAQGAGRRHRRLNGCIGILQNERELVGFEPLATGQHLLALKVRLAIQRAGCGVRVRIRYRARLTSSDLALSTVGLCREAIARRLAYLIVPACGKPVHVQGLARLQGTLRLAVLAECQHELITLLLAVRVLHHSVEIFADGILHRDGELEGLLREISRVVPIGQLQLLRHRQRAGLIDAQLAVIAQIGVYLRLRGRLLGAAPLRVQHVRSRGRTVLFLDLVQFVDVGQTRRAGLEVAGTRRGILGDNALSLLSGIAGEGHMLGLRNGLAVLHGIVVVLVVVRGAALHRLRGRGACLVGVDRRVLREVIVAIARCRLERGDRVARFLAGPLVGIEVHLARFGVGVIRHIRLHGVIGVLQQIERRRLHAGGVQHRNRRGVRDAHRVLRQIDGEVVQRDQGRGRLHLHLVAHRSIVRTRDGDHDVLQVGSGQTGMHVAAEMVGVDVPVRGLGFAAVHLSVVHELGQVGDLHVIAQLIIEDDVAIPALEAFACLRGIAGALRDLLGDVVEHMLQLIGVGRALVERGVCAIGTLRTIAEVPFVFARPQTRALVRIRRRRVVARHGVHELVLVGNALLIGILCRIRALEDADGVHHGTLIFHVLSASNGARGDLRRECALGRRRSVSKEDDDLLGI